MAQSEIVGTSISITAPGIPALRVAFHGEFSGSLAMTRHRVFFFARVRGTLRENTKRSMTFMRQKRWSLGTIRSLARMLNGPITSVLTLFRLRLTDLERFELHWSICNWTPEYNHYLHTLTILKAQDQTTIGDIAARALQKFSPEDELQLAGERTQLLRLDWEDATAKVVFINTESGLLYKVVVTKLYKT
ncbi:hypothetical protein CROQUDRAFT_132917 [Cronartium quercuum f. sp. fusiforme G11]|uniref:Uncharacterized protein n=1 Tax=Cronartium quercuum f. sp. fusiforme G11 TaxID=708437 RepID=A0A9P6NGW9_9BASI|nr:hypothetical protein CROQUDRAFT_132917 [Cronartium quercuum f. sp. fusiforme G11]